MTSEQPAAGDGTGEMIRAAGLGKTFKIYPRPWGRLTEWATLGRAVRHEDFVALRDVSFAIGRGESLGVIGINGSGKSTLLKILSGAMYPTVGTFHVTGRVLSLLELGTGLNPELTGRQNVVNSSRLLAFPPGYAEAKMAEIEGFADLSDGFFERPVKLYSSGMLVRLVFSMFACFDPDVFIIDEALSVGDVFFQQKCARRLQEMRGRGVTMLFVSHDLAAVEALCDRVLLLHHGRVRHLGDKITGIRLYYAVSGTAENVDKETRRQGDKERALVPLSPCPLVPLSPSASSLPWQPADERGAIGDGRVRVAGLCFSGPAGGRAPVVEQGQWLEVHVRLEVLRDAPAVNGGIALYDRFDRLLFARGWLNAGVSPLSLRAGQVVVQRFRLKMDMEPGEYALALAASEALSRADSPDGWDQRLGGEQYVELKHAAKVAVLPRSDGRVPFYGPAHLESEVDRFVVGDAIAEAENGSGMIAPAATVKGTT